MEGKDVLVIKKETIEASGGYKPISITTTTYNEVKAVADETRLAISKVACMMLAFALERVEIQK